MQSLVRRPRDRRQLDGDGILFYMQWLLLQLMPTWQQTPTDATAAARLI